MPAILVRLGTGRRRGELTSLQWSDVDVHTKRLTVRAGYAKSGKARHVPLNSEVVDVLKRWRKQNVLKAAKVQDLRWHDLRHDFASQLAMRGVSLTVIRELLGHASLLMTQRYAYLAPEHKAAVVEMLVKS